MKAEKFCPQCGKRNRATAKVCTQCGRSFKTVADDTPDEQWCPDCGTANSPDAKFCRQCGHKFVSVPAVPPEPPLKQPVAGGISLPQTAEIPPFPDDLPEDPEPPDAGQERFGGKTGIILSPDELEKLRKSKDDETIFVANPRNKKKSR